MGPAGQPGRTEAWVPGGSVLGAGVLGQKEAGLWTEPTPVGPALTLALGDRTARSCGMPGGVGEAQSRLVV